MEALKNFIDRPAGGMLASAGSAGTSIAAAFADLIPHTLGVLTAFFACVTGFCVCRHWMRKEFGWFPRKRREERDEDDTDEDAEAA